MSEGQTTRLNKCLEEFRAGKESAREDLLAFAQNRLLKLARKMLRSYPRLRRWEQTEDVLQNAQVRLYKALKKTTPESLRHFFNLASLEIRRELVDLARHYFGKEGLGANMLTDPSQKKAAAKADSKRPDRWVEFYEQIDALPIEARAIIDLLFVQGLAQDEAAKVLGVSERTLQRRWQAVKIKLFQAMQGQLPV